MWNLSQGVTPLSEDQKRRIIHHRRTLKALKVRKTPKRLKREIFTQNLAVTRLIVEVCLPWIEKSLSHFYSGSRRRNTTPTDHQPKVGLPKLEQQDQEQQEVTAVSGENEQNPGGREDKSLLHQQGGTQDKEKEATTTTPTTDGLTDKESAWLHEFLGPVASTS